MMRKAFTLVELLVVFSIIALMSLIAVVSANSAKTQARNAARLADVRQIVNAFTVNYVVNDTYPQSGNNAWYCLSTACGGAGWNFPFADSTNGVLTFFQFPALLNDPTDNIRGHYGYVYNGDFVGGSQGTGPYLAYVLEKTTNNQCPFGILFDNETTYFQCMARLDK